MASLDRLEIESACPGSKSDFGPYCFTVLRLGEAFGSLTTMLLATAPVTFDLLLSTRPIVSASIGTRHDTVALSGHKVNAASGVDLTKTFAGGQFLVYVTKPSQGTMDFMTVQADDLLASYAFDSAGNLQDRTIWDDSAIGLQTEEVYRTSSVAIRKWKENVARSPKASEYHFGFKRGNCHFVLTIRPLDAKVNERGVS